MSIYVLCLCGILSIQTNGFTMAAAKKITCIAFCWSLLPFRLGFVKFSFDNIFSPPFGGASVVETRSVVDHCWPQFHLEHFSGCGVVQNGFSPRLSGCLLCAEVCGFLLRMLLLLLL